MVYLLQVSLDLSTLLQDILLLHHLLKLDLNCHKGGKSGKKINSTLRGPRVPTDLGLSRATEQWAHKFPTNILSNITKNK